MKTVYIQLTQRKIIAVILLRLRKASCLGSFQIAVLMCVHLERRSTLKLQPAVPVPLEHLEPHTPELSQLVTQWQKLWLLSVARQKHLEQHQQALKEVKMLFERN